VEVKVKHHFKASYSFTALEKLEVDDDVDISKSGESISQTIKASAIESLGHCELKQHRPWYDEECLKLLDQRK
jgi:hypothetical protein